MKSIIDRIIEKEWRMFQDINKGHARADCQENPEMFARMRRAQFGAWSEEACRSYEQDLISAEAAGRNLPEEKYIHMMARCTPEDYAALCGRLPELPPEYLRLAEAVNCRLMDEIRVMREKYPFLNRIGRPLEPSGDNAVDTSVETYQLGELLTYSQQTLNALLRHIDALKAQGDSLAMHIQLASLQALGFYSFEDAAELVMRQKPLG